MGVGGARLVSCGRGGGRGIDIPREGILALSVCAPWAACFQENQATVHKRKHILPSCSVSKRVQGKPSENRETRCGCHCVWQVARCSARGAFFGAPAGTAFTASPKAPPIAESSRCHRRRLCFAGHVECWGPAQRGIADPFSLALHRNIFTGAVVRCPTARCGETVRGHLYPGSHVARRIRGVPPDMVGAFCEHQSGSLQSLS